MSRKRQDAQRETPATDAGQEAKTARLRTFISGMYWLAGACLFGLALVELADAGTLTLRWLLMGGIAIAGTAVIILQAQRQCPHCGASYGYYPRLIRTNICRRCGGEFPRWSPGERA